MTQAKLKLVVHQVRLRILQQLSLQQLTTKQLCALLPDVPQSSVYRHMSLLLEGGMIAVTDTNPVRGIEEKVYALAQSPRIAANDDMSDLTPDDHLRYFTIFATTLIEGFSRYIHADPQPDMRIDAAGYTETIFYASPQEMAAIVKVFNDALLPALQQKPGSDRQQRKISIVTHPINPAHTENQNNP